MAEQNNNLFNRLKRLFGSSVVIRKTSDNRLVVKDVDFTQMGLTTNFIDRYTRLSSGTGWGTKYSAQQNAKNSYEIARNELFRDFESMDSDAIISSALDIYSDESNITGIDGSILSIKTNSAKLHKILHNLFYDILNIEFNLWSWLRNLTKYGDFFLLLDIADKYGIVNVKPLSPYDVIRLEDHDPSDPKLVQYEITGASDRNIGPKSERKLYENYEIAHFRLLSDSNFLPYGKSMLEGARKIWKQLTLMEDSMLIHRIMRAPEKRIFKIDIGNIPPNEVDNYMQKIINRMKKIPVIDQTTGELNLRYNVESVLEDYFMPVRGGDSGTEIDTLPGLSNDNAIDDIEYLRCLRGDTYIKLLDGKDRTIKDIANNLSEERLYTWSINPKTLDLEPVEIINAKRTLKNTKLVRVTLDNKKYVECTPDHRFMLRDGTYKEAQFLESGDSLMPIYTKITDRNNYLSGYEMIYNPGNNRWRYSHRLISEHKYPQLKHEKHGIIHHVNFLKIDNSFDNLLLMTASAHRKLHGFFNRYKHLLVGELNPNFAGYLDWNKIVNISKSVKNMRGFKSACKNVYGNYTSALNTIYKQGYTNKSFASEIIGNPYVYLNEGIDERESKNTIRNIFNYFINKKSYERKDIHILSHNLKCSEYTIGTYIRKEGYANLKDFYIKGILHIYNVSDLKNISNNKTWSELTNYLGVNQSVILTLYKNMTGNILRDKKDLGIIEKRVVWNKGMKGQVAWNKGMYTSRKLFYCCVCNNSFHGYGERAFCSKKCQGKKYGEVYKGSNDFSKLGDHTFVRDGEFLNHSVLYVEPIRDTDDTYDIEVSKNSNFALSSGIFVHNSKMMAALKIPKAFLGYDENLGSKCLHPDTEIPLLNNTTKTIKEIADEFANNGDPNWWVYSYDRENNSIIPAKIKLAEQTRKNAKLIRVYLDNNTYVDCTPDHNFVLRGGEKKQAQDLILDDSLQAVYRRTKRMSNNTNHYEQVYQPSIDRWIYTHKMIDSYFNGSIEKNGWIGDRFARESLIVIHHRDFNNLNNSPDNLQRLKLYDHIKLHAASAKMGFLSEKGKARAIATKRLPENRKKSSERQKQRIKDNPELRYKLRDSYRAMTHEERSEKCRKAYTQEMREALTKRNIDTNSYLRLREGYDKKYPNGIKWDTIGELNGNWVNRPSIDELIEFMRINQGVLDISTIYKFSKEFGISKYIIQEVIESNGYTVDEWMNYYYGFRPGRKKHLRYDDFVEISAGFENRLDFIKSSGMGEAALQSNLNRLNIDEHYWKNNILASTYNHKVVNIEWLDERIDTYNLEVDDENHNYLISNGIIIKNSTLAAEDVRFARTIERLQKIVVAELEKIAIVHLYAQGFTDAELLSFDLRLTNPSMIHEQEKLELLNQQVDIAQSAIENKLFSQNWIYDNIFDLNEHQKRELMKEIVIDSKQKFRHTQIEDEGNDPFETGEKVDDDDDNSSSSLKGDWGGSEKDPQYTHHDFGNARAKDMKDATKYEREHYGKREFKGGSPLYPGKGSTIVKTEGLLDQLKKKFKNQEKKGGLLSEDLLFVEEEA